MSFVASLRTLRRARGCIRWHTLLSGLSLVRWIWRTYFQATPDQGVGPAEHRPRVMESLKFSKLTVVAWFGLACAGRCRWMRPGVGPVGARWGEARSTRSALYYIFVSL